MKFKKPDSNYWDDKFSAYMHDPIDKVFRIQDHEERGAKQLEAFGTTFEELYNAADFTTDIKTVA